MWERDWSRFYRTSTIRLPCYVLHLNLVTCPRGKHYRCQFSQWETGASERWHRFLKVTQPSSYLSIWDLTSKHMFFHVSWTLGDATSVCADLNLLSFLPLCVFQCRIWLPAAGRQVPWSSTESGGSRASWGGISPTKVPGRALSPWETGLKAENQEGEEEMLLVDLSSWGPLPLPFPRWGTTALRPSLLLSEGPRLWATRPVKPEQLGAGLAATGHMTTPHLSACHCLLRTSRTRVPTCLASCHTSWFVSLDSHHGQIPHRTFLHLCNAKHFLPVLGSSSQRKETKMLCRAVR